MPDDNIKRNFSLFLFIFLGIGRRRNDFISIWLRDELLAPVRFVYEKNRADATSLLGEISAVIDKFGEVAARHQPKTSAVLVEEYVAMRAQILTDEALIQDFGGLRRNIQANLRAFEASLQRFEQLESLNDKFHH